MGQLSSRDARSRDTLDATQFVPHYLTVASNAMTAAGSRWFLNTYGFGLNEGRIIAVLGHHPGLTAAELGQLMAMNKSIVSRGLSFLTASKLVRGEGPARGRRNYLTEKAVPLHDEIIRSAATSRDRMLEGFSLRQQEQLLSLMKKLYANVQKHYVNGGSEEE